MTSLASVLLLSVSVTMNRIIRLNSDSLTHSLSFIHYIIIIFFFCLIILDKDSNVSIEEEDKQYDDSTSSIIHE